MPRSPFKHHRFPPKVILCAVRWYCRYALSCRDVRDLLAERGIEVDASTIHRWVRKFSPEIAKHSFKHRSWRGLNWQVDETYIRVGGPSQRLLRKSLPGSEWRYLWRAVDQRGQLVDFRLTARQDAKATRAFLKQACENARLYQPRSITTDKAHSYALVIGEMNRFEMPGEGITHINRKWDNNRIEIDHAALKKLTTPMRGFKSLSAAKATLRGIEAIRTIKHGHVHGKQPGVTGEIHFVHELFGLAA